MKTFTKEQVAEHNKANDLWIIVNGKVFDLTKFVNEHPGGKKVLLKVAGKDASKQFKTFHNDAIMQRVGLPMQIGVIGDETASKEKEIAAPVNTKKQEVTPKQVDIHQLVSAEHAKFGEGVPYGDPTWYQEWNR